MSEFIDSHSHVSKLDSAGGKAFNLFLIEKANIKVPHWFAIPSSYFETHYRELEKSILKEIQLVSLKDLDSLKNCAKNIENLFLQRNLESSFVELIQKRVSNEKSYSVRSSAKDEDGQMNSFAGQLDSYLNCRGIDEITEAIKKVWASIFSERNIQYRILNEIHTTPAVGVIIQDMVEVESSGVMFTAHPLLNEGYLDQVVINAGYGLGEGVVSDQVEVDTYLYSKSKKSIIDHLHGKKTKMVVPNKSAQGTCLVEVEPAKSLVSVLNRTQIMNLVAQGLRLEKSLNCEQDIEWCISTSGELFITQTRPITTLLKGTNKLDFLFDNSNIVESFPGVNTPWTLGQVKDIYRIAFKRTCLRLGFGREKVNQNNFLFASLLGLYRGRVYLNLTHWSSMMRLIPFTERYVKAWEESLGVKTVETKRAKNQLSEVLRAIIVFSRIIYYLIFLGPILKKLDRSQHEAFDEFWSHEDQGKALTPVEAINELEAFKAKIFENSEFTLINDILAFTFTSFTKELIKNWSDKDPDQSFNKLLLGQEVMDSVKPLVSINKLVELKLKYPELEKALVAFHHSPQIPLEVLSSFEGGKEFIELFNEYILKFGDRGLNELKLETLTFRERPEDLIKLILSYDKVLELSQKSSDDHVFEFKGFLKKPIFKLCLHLAKRSINYRENFRLNRTRAYGVLRRMTNNLGRKLAALEALDSPRDIYYLDKEDLYQFYSGLSFDFDLKSIVMHKKQLFYQYKQVDVFNRYTFRQGILNELKTNSEPIRELKGVGCAAGKVTAEALVITEVTDKDLDASKVKGKILVARMTDPGWVFLMANSKGLLVEKGSLLSHTAIIGRELGVPTIVGVAGATELIKSGDRIELDAFTGTIRILS